MVACGWIMGPDLSYKEESESATTKECISG